VLLLKTRSAKKKLLSTIDIRKRIMKSNNKSNKKSLPPIFYILGVLLISVLGFGAKSIFTNASPSSLSITSNEPHSEGKIAFFLQDGTPDKSAGLEAYSTGNYSLAQAKFEKSLQQKPNDPEALIYSNNAKSVSRNPVKIAITIPGNGDINGSHEVLRGVAQAQQEINSGGGINGRMLMVMIVNDGNNIATARQIAQDLAARSDILGVIGHYASGVTLGVADIYTQGNLVAISPVSSAVQISNKSPYLLRTVPSDSTAAKALSNYMVSILHRKKAVVYFNSESEYSKSLKGEFRGSVASQGGNVVAEFDLANSSFNGEQSLAKAREQGAEVIMLASDSSALDRAYQVVQSNKNVLPLLGGDDVYTSKTLDVTREQGQNMVLAVPWHVLGAGSENFAKRSRSLWGGDVNWRTATAYDATQALKVAIGIDPTRRGVQKALTSSGFTAPGASRNIAFLPSGDRNVPAQLVKITKGVRSRYGYDFVPVP
jgi:branched-chain amino acid transport system substrate-binding protein